MTSDTNTGHFSLPSRFLVPGTVSSAQGAGLRRLLAGGGGAALVPRERTVCVGLGGMELEGVVGVREPVDASLGGAL